jgi:hypothetical protein
MTHRTISSPSLLALQSAASSWRESHPPQEIGSAQPSRSTAQSSGSGMYPQLPQQALESPPLPGQPVGASQPNSTQKLRDEIAALNLNIAESHKAAAARSEGEVGPSERVLEGASVAGAEGVEEELPSAPTHRIPARVRESGRVAAQYAG